MPETRTPLPVPPVIEVAIAVAFEPLPELGPVGLARLASDWQTEYPVIREVPGQPPTALTPIPGIQFGTGSLPSRLWLLSEDENHLLQIQNDTFVVNWRRIRADDVYPEHSELLARFERLFLEFQDKTARHGAIRPRLVEWTYVNRLEGSDGLTFIDGALESTLPGVAGSFSFQIVRELRTAESLDGYLAIVGGQAVASGTEAFYALNISTKLNLVGSPPGEATSLLMQAHDHSYSAFKSVVSPRLQGMRPTS